MSITFVAIVVNKNRPKAFLLIIYCVVNLVAKSYDRLVLEELETIVNYIAEITQV